MKLEHAALPEERVLGGKTYKAAGVVPVVRLETLRELAAAKPDLTLDELVRLLEQ